MREMLVELSELRFFTTAEHDCGYLPGKMARTVVADPEQVTNMARYSRLAEYGFRRSGDHVYVPHCGECQACIPVRVDTARFTARRIQRRVIKRNADLQETWRPAAYDPEHFALYQRYMQARHADGSMARHTADDYAQFLLCEWSHTELLELRNQTELVAVAVVDVLETGLSSVYTFFAPEASGRSLGVDAVLRTLARCRRESRPWLYLGYWIDTCAKMSYKRDYVPQQRYQHGHWVTWNG
jgi:leucyl-tRNA---protein transferase